ncbi:glycosyltransferase [Pseudomonas protegens]|uniref:glycosyltransferase n=1 Tax=Pseudomonas protegens TaxID=380021 RepID=UPI0011B3D019|nr:glycosyltransferase [Pseudomonas protegens]
MNKRKKNLKGKVVFFTYKNYRNNPMLKMYTSAFKTRYDCLVSCFDSKTTPPEKDIQLTNISINHWEYIRALYRKSPIELKNLLKKINFIKKISLYLLTLLFIVNFIINNFIFLAKQFRFVKSGVRLVFAVDGDYLLASWLTARLLGAKFYYFVYEIWPDQYPVTSLVDRAEKSARTALEYFFCNRADKVITVQDVVSKYIRRKYHLNNNVMATIPVCPDKYSATTFSVETPLKLHYHGAYQASRGLDELILAFKQVSSATLYLRGVGDYEKILRDLVIKENLTERIFFLDAVPSDQLVSNSVSFDVGVILASPNTGNGRMCVGFKLYEYINSGLAVLAPSSLPLMNVLRKSGCGVTYGWPNSNKIAAQIELMKSDISAVMEMKKAAIKLSRTYNSEYQIDRLLKLTDLS